MNKLLIGLCAAALSVGGVSVGAVALNRHDEVRADGTIKRVYFKDAAWWCADNARTGIYAWKGESGQETTNESWPGKVMDRINDIYTLGGNIWYADIDTSHYDKIIFTRYGATGKSDWGAKSPDIVLSSISDSTPMYDISDKEAVWGDPGVAGEWVAYEEPEPTPVIANGTYLVGTHNSWTADSNSIGATGHGTDKAAWENIELAAAVQFKLRVVQS